MSDSLRVLEPGLYIVATPIGNLADLSPRAADILGHADVIAVEDSRVTAGLLRHIGVKRPMVPYHDHNAEGVRPGLIARMATEAVALVSALLPGSASSGSAGETDKAALVDAALALGAHDNVTVIVVSVHESVPTLTMPALDDSAQGEAAGAAPAPDPS